jgi:N-succinyldiaminopimelate aminotransferase
MVQAGTFIKLNPKLRPGSFLARSVAGRNPGTGFVRLALVDDLDACIEAAGRIRAFVTRSDSRAPT